MVEAKVKHEWPLRNGLRVRVIQSPEGGAPIPQSLQPGDDKWAPCENTLGVSHSGLHEVIYLTELARLAERVGELESSASPDGGRLLGQIVRYEPKVKTLVPRARAQKMLSAALAAAEAKGAREMREAAAEHADYPIDREIRALSLPGEGESDG